MIMNNVVILPILIPFIAGILLLFFTKHVIVQRFLSVLSTVATLVVAFVLLMDVYNDGIISLEVGNWKPPFGIVLVGDLLSIILIITTNIISLACLIYSFKSIGINREKYYYYAFFQFLITGISGAFLTGDIFNLFVFFEVILMSSYAMIVHGGTKIQFRETIKYILVNIISSALFVITVAFLFAITGTLNMADLSVRVAEVNQEGMLTVVAILFMIVFGLKGAIFPLFFWLPGSYQSPPTVVTAIFGALLTKVGVYAIFRTYTIIFYHHQGITHQFLGILAALTIIIGVIGAIAYFDIKKIIIYNIITAVGVILFGVSVATPDSLSGALYYLVHDMIIKATLFLLVGAIITITGTSDLRKMGGLIRNHPILGWMFFVAAVSLAGVPPLSGFVGKILIVRGGFDDGNYIIAGIVLLSSLFVLYSVMKIFMTAFWGEVKLAKEEEKGSAKGLLFPASILLTIAIFIGLGAEFLYPFIDTATTSLLDPSIYIESVLKE